jgi:hypothetical protein
MPSIGVARFGEDEAMLWNPSALNDYPNVHTLRWRPSGQRLVSPLSIDWIDLIPYVTAGALDAAFDELLCACFGVRRASR